MHNTYSTAFDNFFLLDGTYEERAISLRTEIDKLVAYVIHHRDIPIEKLYDRAQWRIRTINDYLHELYKEVSDNIELDGKTRVGTNNILFAAEYSLADLCYFRLRVTPSYMKTINEDRYRYNDTNLQNVRFLGPQ